VFRLDRAAVVAALRERSEELLAARPDVVEVRLFGSLARADAAPGSDADLFVLIESAEVPLLDRIPPLLRHFSGLGIGCDVIAYARQEYADAKARGDRFAETVEQQGVVLAARAPR